MNDLHFNMLVNASLLRSYLTSFGSANKQIRGSLRSPKRHAMLISPTILLPIVDERWWRFAYPSNAICHFHNNLNRGVKMLNYKELRERYKYKPRKIKCLLIAESPPRSEDKRFFYNPDQDRYDFLFKSVMEVIFPNFTNNYRKGQKHE